MIRDAALLPSHLVGRLATGPAPAVPSVDRFEAALLFSDVSGFTALTERLQARGREGAEEIAGVVNGVLRPAIDHVDAYGGSVAGFAGDSLLALFTGECAVGSAVAAAEGIARCGGRVATSAGPAELGIAQVVHWGEVHGVHLGHGGRRHYVTTGPSIAELARQEQDSVAGVVGLSRRARRRLAREPPLSPRPRQAGAARRGALSRLGQAYLPAHVATSLPWLRGEFRRVVVAFFETRGFEPATLQRHYAALARLLHECEASLVGTDTTVSGVRWLCAFGAARAHEDEPARAARTALALLAAGGRSVRGGMHHGTAAAIWMGSPSRCSFETLGDVTNTAARVLSRARWGEVLVTAQLRGRLDAFDAAARGSHAVKGKRVPLELLALGLERPRTAVAAARSPLVGRDDELRRLCDAAAAARAGGSRVVALVGQAGTGKSRLVWELSRRAVELGLEVHAGRCRAFGGRPYEPLAELLRGILALPPGSAAASVARRLAREKDLDERAREHLAEVLGARAPGSPLAFLDAGSLRRGNAAAVGKLLSARSRVRPLLLILEDLHWADEMTRNAMPAVSAALAGSPVMMLLAQRPGPPLPVVDDALEIAELPALQTAELVAGLLGAVTPRLVSLVVDKAGGNPLFVEEVVRYLRDHSLVIAGEDGETDLAAELPEIPDAIEGVVAARLSQLPPAARRLVQVGAAIGRRFPRALLAGFPELRRGLATTLRVLEERQLIFVEPQGVRAEAGFVFKHALVRDVAYAGILLAERGRIHRAVAEALEERVEKGREDEVALLAHHWELGGEPARARPRYLAAARRAALVSAHGQAEACYRSWLRLDDGSDAERPRVKAELGERVLSLLGRWTEARTTYLEAAADARAARQWEVCAQAMKGIAIIDMAAGRSDDAQRTFEEAIALLPRNRSASARAIILNSLGACHNQRGRQVEAMRCYRRALAVHRREGDMRREAVVLGNLGVAAFSLGDLVAAERRYLQALEGHRAVGDRIGEGRTLGNLASICFDVGRIEESTARFEQALALQRASGNRPSEGVLLGHLAGLQRQTLRIGDALESTRLAIEIAREVGDRDRELMWLSNQGGTACIAGRHGLARGSHRAAAELGARVGSRFLARCFTAWAQLEYADGHPGATRRLVARARLELEGRPDASVEAMVHHLEAYRALDEGDLRGARRGFHESARFAHAVPRPPLEAASHLMLAAIALEGGRLRSADAWLRRADAAYDEMHDRGGLLCAAALRARLELAGGRPGAGELLAARLELAREAGAPKLHAELLCELALARVSQGRNAGDLAAAAEEARGSIDVGPRSTIELALRALRRSRSGRRTQLPPFRIAVALP